MVWQKYFLSDLLTERMERYKPDEANLKNLKRIDKITQNGEIFLSRQKSNTNMILVKNGDLVISGIGVGKGGGNSFNIYDGREDILATIHYSSYVINTNIVRKDFLKKFLKSSFFRRLLKQSSPSGIKAEIKAKHILPLEIFIPNLKIQEKIVKEFLSFEKELANLNAEIFNQEKYLDTLRRMILDEVVQGKIVPQVPDDEPGSVLLDKIKREKEKLIKEKKIKKEKPLSPISDIEIPYELPDSWEWVRFGEVNRIDSNLVRPEKYENMPHVAPNNITKNTGVLLSYNTVKEDKVTSPKHYFYPNQILYSKIRPELNKAIIVDFEGLCSADMYPISSYIYLKYVLLTMLSNYFLTQSIKYSNRIKMPKINQPDLKKILFPLPPLNEQKRIVENVDKLMKLCDELEEQVKENQKNSELLMDAVLREAFEN